MQTSAIDRICAMLDKIKLDAIANEIEEAGHFAYRMQKSVHRSFKKDGSVLTEADTTISHSIIERIHSLFPEAAVISEEEETGNNMDAEWIFILDPIDGTDVYSQGMPSFAVSLGVLDKNRNPVAAYIAAPRFGTGEESLFIRLDPDGKPTVNGEELTLHGDKDDVREIMMGSKGAHDMDFSRFDGKIRVLGSTILHILSPALFPSVEGVVVQKCFVWDIISSHAILKSLGMDLEDENGNLFKYSNEFIFSKRMLSSILYGGTEKGRAYLRATLPPLR